MALRMLAHSLVLAQLLACVALLHRGVDGGHPSSTERQRSWPVDETPVVVVVVVVVCAETTTCPDAQRVRAAIDRRPETDAQRSRGGYAVLGSILPFLALAGTG
ncbi:hypothetical protein IWZ03DRAFT_404669 [Phyllosticta citriasiana]|uniref:Secreted protein n=1 Tax=Phyllosticta citriasiana TaxID=595635 RepID=A0ABR1KTN0_9PEZI